MTRPRCELVSVHDTPYYHVVSRCVRRAFLCGDDRKSGKCYNHRRQWIEGRIRILSSIFGIQICSYSVMSNHYHIVIKLCPDEIAVLSDHEIVARWTSIFKGPSVLLKQLEDNNLDAATQAVVDKWVSERRGNLADLGWFMKCLNEPIARQANKEDRVTGHFWEGRYKSQALLTEEAILSAMTYVDLNPIRAKMADTPEDSEHTSIKARIEPTIDLTKAVKEQIEQSALKCFNLPLKPLEVLEGGVREDVQNGVLFSFSDYLELVDYTGRILRPNKRGAIPAGTPSILERLGIDLDTWFENTDQFERFYRSRFMHHKHNYARTG